MSAGRLPFKHQLALGSWKPTKSSPSDTPRATRCAAPTSSAAIRTTGPCRWTTSSGWYAAPGGPSEGPPGAAYQPDEVVHRHGPVVRIAADEVGAAQRVARGVSDGEDFVGFHDPRANWCLKGSLPADIVGNKQKRRGNDRGQREANGRNDNAHATPGP